MKIHYETQNLFLKTFFFLREEVQNENFDEETYQNQKNLIMMLRNNDKILPKPEEMMKLCFGLLIYNLCFSEAYEQSKVQNTKKESKFLKSQLLSFFYSKVQILENLKNFTGKYIKFVENDSLKDLLTILKKFLEYGISEIDQLIIDILANISNQIPFTNENIEILINLTFIIETVLLRFKESYSQGNNDHLDSNLIKAIKIQCKNLKEMIEKGQFSLANCNDIQELVKNEKFTLLSNFIFSILDIFNFHKNANIWYQIISPIIVAIFERLNVNWAEIKLKEDLFYLYLLNIYDICKENHSFKHYMILIFLSIYGVFRASNSNELKEEDCKIFQLYSSIISIHNLASDKKEFKDLLFLCRSVWQEQKNLEINCSLPLLEISFSHILQIKQEITEDINKIDQNFIIEIMKFFLAIYLFLNEEKKENFFYPLIEFVFLFINRSFPNQILSLANQILKHILKSAKEELIRSTMQKLPEELRNVVDGVLQMEKMGSQDHNEKNNDEGKKTDFEERNLNKEEKNQSGQGKIKLKLFGSKKN